MNEYQATAPLATVDGTCYFCRTRTHYLYKMVRLCSRHDTPETRGVIDAQQILPKEDVTDAIPLR